MIETKNRKSVLPLFDLITSYSGQSKRDLSNVQHSPSCSKMALQNFFVITGDFRSWESSQILLVLFIGLFEYVEPSRNLKFAVRLGGPQTFRVVF